MQFVVKKIHRNISDEELLADVKKTVISLGMNTISQEQYNQYGTYNSSTLTRRFGSWFKVLDLCNFVPSRSNINIPTCELFANLERIWITLGRQPKYAEIIKPLSRYSVGTYEKRFGSFYNALDEFVGYVNQEADNITLTVKEDVNTHNHKTKRNPSDRLKVQVLMRDGNRCRLCGIECNDGLHNIHFDHIIPWSKGGETELDNLQVLCSDCNLAKGNI